MRVGVIVVCLAALALPALAQPAAGRRPALRLPQRRGVVTQATTPQTPPPLQGPTLGRGPGALLGGDARIPSSAEALDESGPWGDGIACVLEQHLRVGTLDQSTGQTRVAGYYRLRHPGGGSDYYLSRAYRHADPIYSGMARLTRAVDSNTVTGPATYWWNQLQAAWIARRPVRLTIGGGWVAAPTEPGGRVYETLVSEITLLAEGQC